MNLINIKQLNMKLKLLFTYIIFACFTVICPAQVTIGSDVPPRKGALLDLKENDSTGKQPNSRKGLKLPRVALSSLTKLTLDDDAKADDYVGTTVYNVTVNTELAEGTYCWYGNTWKQVIWVDNPGLDGDLLINNGDLTYKWANIKVSAFTYHKPSQIAVYNKNKAPLLKYKFNQIVAIETGPSVFTPVSGLFDNDFAYTETLNIKTPAASEKYILMEASIDIKKLTIGNTTFEKGFWEIINIDFLVDGELLKNYWQVYSFPKGGDPVNTIELFSIVPLTNSGKGSHQFKMRVSVDSSLYYANKGSGAGQFREGNNDFLEIQVKNLGFILYENE